MPGSSNADVSAAVVGWASVGIWDEPRAARIKRGNPGETSHNWVSTWNLLGICRDSWLVSQLFRKQRGLVDAPIFTAPQLALLHSVDRMPAQHYLRGVGWS